jgi:uncharacterized protein (DUF488 family)
MREIMPKPFYTIGHSTRPVEAFAQLLHEADVRLVIDVRSIPRSRTNPQYNADVLPASLAALGVGYDRLAGLGGRRGRQRGVPPDTNAFWSNASFRNFADYAMGEAFQACFCRLRELGHAQVCAIMCAEGLWWRCHRRIIADYLIAAGETVFHIVAPGKIAPAQMNPAARPAEQAGPLTALVYPAEGR